MKAVGGIDEAGLGPTLGPLCFGATLFLGPDAAVADLRAALSDVVAREPERGAERLAVDDSKRLFGGGRRSLAPLELPALALARPGAPRATTLEELVGGECDAGHFAPWYRDGAPLPVEVAADVVDGWRARLDAALAGRGLRVALALARPLLEPELNGCFDAGLNKADAVLAQVGPLLKRMVAAAPGCDVELVVDRLGGRRYYGDFLRHLFPLRPIATLVEETSRSRYRLQEGGRAIEVAFEVAGDQNHLPIAWASVLAKYARELFLARMNGHFAARRPGLAPTAGYPQDAARWLADAADVLQPGERELLVRRR